MPRPMAGEVISARGGPPARDHGRLTGGPQVAATLPAPACRRLVLWQRGRDPRQVVIREAKIGHPSTLQNRRPGGGSIRWNNPRIRLLMQGAGFRICRRCRSCGPWAAESPAIPGRRGGRVAGPDGASGLVPAHDDLEQVFAAPPGQQLHAHVVAAGVRVSDGGGTSSSKAAASDSESAETSRRGTSANTRRRSAAAAASPAEHSPTTNRET